MSLENLIGDVFSGNFSNAIKRVEDFFSGVPTYIKSLVTTLASDEGKILQSLVATAAQDVISGGLTTASFVSAGKDVLAKLEAQNITLGMQTVMATLNAAVAAVQPVQAQQSAPPAA